MDPLLAALTSTCDPLTDVVRRVRTERAAVAATVADPVRAGVWFSALIRPLVQALPPGDPWRGLTVRLPDGSQVPSAEVLANEPGAVRLSTPGAVGPDGTVFGTVEAHLDLIPRGAEDLADDVALAGLAEDIPLPSAYLLAAASEARDTAELAAQCIKIGRLSPTDGGFTVPSEWSQLFGGVATDGAQTRAEAYYLLSAALRWALVRYRTYTGETAVSGELPQLGLEVEQWLAGMDLSRVDTRQPEQVWTRQLSDVLAAVGPEPPLRGIPIPLDGYEDFRIR